VVLLSQCLPILCRALFKSRSDEFWKPAQILKVAWLQGDGGNLWPVAYGLESLDNSAYEHTDRLLVPDFAAIGTAINAMYRVSSDYAVGTMYYVKLQFAAEYMIIRRCDHYRS
ncbi:unnamed protein product, partial [Fusarium graminearum]